MSCNHLCVFTYILMEMSQNFKTVRVRLKGFSRCKKNWESVVKCSKYIRFLIANLQHVYSIVNKMTTN